MRKLTIVYTSLFLAFLLFFAGKQINNSMTVYFPTLGNCYWCKVRIEDAVNALDGIEEVDWNNSEMVTYVTYDEGITDPFIIMDAIAYVGHDTEWYPATDSAYNSLVGTCCEYERTIDYTNVQVGYLSLMGIWVTHVGLDENIVNAEISVYPAASSGVFNVSFNGLETSKKYDLSVYSLNGMKLYHAEIEATDKSTLDLSNLNNGQYIVVLRKDETVIAKTKIIKL